MQVAIEANTMAAKSSFEMISSLIKRHFFYNPHGILTLGLAMYSVVPLLCAAYAGA